MYGRFAPAYAQIQELKAARDGARATATAGGDDSRLDEGNDRWPDLTNGGNFSAQLLPTYNLVILSIAVIVGMAHWHGQMKRWRRRRTARLIEKANTAYDKDGPMRPVNQGPAIELAYSESGSSSSSSTLDVGLVPETVKPVIDEEDSPVSSRLPRKFPYSALDRWRSWLAYQPHPIPIFNKTLPSNGATLAGTLFILLNIVYLTLGMHFRILYIIVFGDRCALVFIYNLPLLYIFAAKTQPLSFITGYSYESLNIIHRRLGELLCFCGLVHSIFMFLGYFTFLSKVGFTLYTFVFNQTVLTGIAVLVCYETIYFTSLASFRQRWYEGFLAVHVVLQAGALALLYFHHRNNKNLVLIALLIFTVDRVIYRLWRKSTTVLAAVSVAEDEYTVILKTSIPYRTPGLFAAVMGHEISHGWAPTDHVFITAPSLGRSHTLQAHPFTILSPSPRSVKPGLAEGDVMQLDLLVRAYDGFTSDLLKHSSMNRSLRVRIDGPYGGCHTRDVVDGTEQAILIAGGSGIAVIWPIVHFLISRSSWPYDTESGSRGSGDGSGSRGKGRILFIWVVQRRSQLSWLSDEEIKEVRKRGVEVITPAPTQEAGRPNLREVIREKVEMCGGRAGVVVSGPDSMGRDVRNCCSELIGEGKRVGITVEKFGW